MLGLLTGVVAWLRQPTSVAGIAGILGSTEAVLTGQSTLAHALPVIVAGTVALAIPDNSGVPQLVGKLIEALEQVPAAMTTTTVVTDVTTPGLPPAPSTPTLVK